MRQGGEPVVPRRRTAGWPLEQQPLLVLGSALERRTYPQCAEARGEPAGGNVVPCMRRILRALRLHAISSTKISARLASGIGREHCRPGVTVARGIGVHDAVLHPGEKRLTNLLQCNRGRPLKLVAGGKARVSTSPRVTCPHLRQIQLIADTETAVPVGGRPAHGDLSAIGLAQSLAAMARHSEGVKVLLGEPRVVDDLVTGLTAHL